MNVILTRDGLATRAEVFADPGSIAYPERLTGVGEARCNPGDLYNQAVGDGIAVGRAMSDFGRQLVERWESRSVCNEVEFTIQTTDGDVECRSTHEAFGEITRVLRSVGFALVRVE